MWLARCLLLIVALHYVDDIGGPEPEWSAASACASFKELCELLGIRVKPSKEQKASFLQKVLGVWIAVSEHYIEVRPDPQRLRKLTTVVQRSLQEDRLTPEEASRLSGKLVFLQTSLFGQVGRAALHPIYARAHGGHAQVCTLNSGLRSALQCILSLLCHALPRQIPINVSQTRTSVLYADAYFRLGEQHWKVGHAQPRHWPRKPVARLQNSWGFLVRGLSHVTAGHGEVPPAVVARFGSRKAYIFFLEVNAQGLLLGGLHR